MKALYTDDALMELDAFRQHQKSLLEQLIATRKCAGDGDVVRITASDIKAASEDLYFRCPPPRLHSGEIAILIYIIIGIALLASGLMYPQIVAVDAAHKVQITMIATGASIIVIGGCLRRWLRDHRLQ